MGQERELDVVVAGAGMAGLACAQVLQAAGVAVKLVDKARGAGGRVTTRSSPGGGWDHGAQYFTVRHPSFAARVAELARRGVVAPWLPRLGPGVAPRDEPWFVGVPGMSALPRALAEGLDLQLQTRLTTARRELGRWLLRDEAGGELRAALLVCTLPAPQAAALLDHGAESAASTAGFLPCWTVLAHPEAPLELDWDVARPDTELAWVARDDSKPGRAGRESWVLQASPAWSAAQLEADAETVAQVLWSAFGEYTGRRCRAALQAHRWRYARAVTTQERPLRFDATRGLVLCGDGFGGSRVEAAWLSGHAAAALVLATLGV